MVQLIRLLWQRNRLVLSAFVLAAMITLFFTVRFAVFWIYWSDPAHQNQPIEGWMTPGYVAYSYHVPREDVTAALGVTPNGKIHRTLEDIAAESGRSIDELITILNATIAASRQGGE